MESPTARLRLLPIWQARDGEPTHYVVLDRCNWTAESIHEAAARLRSVLDAPVLVFSGTVELPEVDDDGDYRDGDEELVMLSDTQMRTEDRARYAAGETSCAGGC